MTPARILAWATVAAACAMLAAAVAFAHDTPPPKCPPDGFVLVPAKEAAAVDEARKAIEAAKAK